MQDMGGHLKIIDNSKQEMTTLSIALWILQKTIKHFFKINLGSTKQGDPHINRTSKFTKNCNLLKK